MDTTPQPEPAAAPPFDLDTVTLPTVGRAMLETMRGYFPGEQERIRQSLALAEEAGEFVGAYRRWAGMARRSGGWNDVEAELADVIITTHVTAAAFNVTLPSVNRLPEGPADDANVAVLSVFEAVGHFTAGCLSCPWQIEVFLARVGATAWDAARCLDIDLEAAWRAKARKVFTRGWRETNRAT